MLVTARQMKLIQFSGFRDFAAVAVFTDPDGNELLRDMENPNHHQFEPDRVQTEQGKQRAKRALNRITNWIRSEIRTVAGPRDHSRTKMIDKLARYLPDLHSDDAFGEGESGSANSEKRFEEGIEVLEREVRRHRAVHLDDQSLDEHEGDGETGHEGGGRDDENNGIGGDGKGSGEGEGEGGSGGRGGGATPIPIRDVRRLNGHRSSEPQRAGDGNGSGEGEGFGPMSESMKGRGGPGESGGRGTANREGDGAQDPMKAG